jgi:hypothetical protein
MLGKRLFSQTIDLQTNNQKEITVDLSAFSAGIYLIKLSGNDEIIYRSVIVSE